MKKIIFIITILVSIYIISSHLSTARDKEKIFVWTGFYLEKNKKEELVGTYPSLESCQSASQKRVDLSINNSKDYVCGSNCRNNGLMYVCDSTKK